jgi:hypothetical protein
MPKIPNVAISESSSPEASRTPVSTTFITPEMPQEHIL